ncbi:MAG: beta-glucosidase [Sphingomonadales bacterium RIFCSPLOWO2_12_FULL_63_15]|nr:MAG: beta-glucosidase [Sphingomonadales bacterium RIFCSPLOWO2_12_FULL_63_15]
MDIVKRVGRAGVAMLFLMSPNLNARPTQISVAGRAVPLIEVQELIFRDLNRNGSLDRYEDWRLSPEDRASDLVKHMSLAEKVGQMVVANAYGNAPFGQPATGYDLQVLLGVNKGGNVTTFNSMLVLGAQDLARAHNEIQAIMEEGRLGIPAVMATDPRHHFQETAGASVGAGDFSQWPESLGFAAIGDARLIETFGDVVRRDLRAVGFQLLLGPQADISTEPRWPRNNGTLGEDPARAGDLVTAYIRGVQGSASGIVPGGVAAVLKHFAGYSAGKDGWDAHNRYGRYAVMDEQTFSLHLKPFEMAFTAQPSSVMPSYAVIQGLTIDGKRVEETGAAYSQVLITDLLRKRYGFDGVVLSDWAITEDCGDICMNGFPKGQRPSFEGVSTAWGVEQLSKPERFAKAINAGVDQFGGVMSPQPIIDAVNKGLVNEAQIDRAVVRILKQTFSLGLFDNPFVDEAAAGQTVGMAADKQAARAAQARAMVLLEARKPLDMRGKRVFLRGANAEAAHAAGLIVVDKPEDAEFAVIRTAAPFQTLHPNYFFGSIQHEGSLAFSDEHPDLVAFRQLSKTLPVVVDVYLDRPAILTPFKDKSAVLLGSFGASDAALFDVLTGVSKAEGLLPFELPSSMAAVAAQRSDKPADSVDPLYPLHYRAGYRH